MRTRFHARARMHTQTAAAGPEKAKEVSEEARAEAEKLKALGTSILAPVHPRALRARSRSTRRGRARAGRSTGNVQMKDKNFEGAIASYSRAIDLNPTVAVYFANRCALEGLRCVSPRASRRRMTPASVLRACGRGTQSRSVPVCARQRGRGRRLGALHRARRDVPEGTQPPRVRLRPFERAR